MKSQTRFPSSRIHAAWSNLKSKHLSHTHQSLRANALAMRLLRSRAYTPEKSYEVTHQHPITPPAGKQTLRARLRFFWPFS